MNTCEIDDILAECEQPERNGYKTALSDALTAKDFHRASTLIRCAYQRGLIQSLEVAQDQERVWTAHQNYVHGMN